MPFTMRYALFLASSLVAVTGALAQQITNVTVTPGPFHECQLATFHVSGTAPSNMHFDFVNSSFGVNSISLVIEASGAASGSSPYNKVVGPSGPFDQGVYALSVSLEYNGTITSTWTGNLTVLPADPPDLGEPTSVVICDNLAPFQLITQLNGTPDPGGVWLDPMLNVVPNGTFVPGTSPAGDYQYYFQVPPPCVPEFQNLNISYLPNNSAGQSISITLCTVAGLPPVDLFTQLGGTPDAGGTWTGLNTTGIFIPGVSLPGEYVYHVTGIAPCLDPAATVTVIGGPASNPGIGDSATYCDYETQADLFNYITGADETGIWYGPDGSGIGFFSQFVDVSSSGAGNYAYVVTDAPCPADTAYVNVTLLGPPCTLGIPAWQARNDRMRVMPNPSNGVATVEINRARPAQGQFIEVWDVNGKVLLRTAVRSMDTTVRQALDVSSLAPGAYLLRLTGGQGATTLPLMVQ